MGQEQSGHARALEDVCSIEPKSSVLGRGTFGTVFRGRLLRDGRKSAVKIIEKKRLQQLKVPASTVSTECEMMHECRGNENFVQLYDVLETKSKFCLIMEYCNGGNLQQCAVSAGGNIEEGQVRSLVQQMLQSVVFLHGVNICHRDIKPHNFFVSGSIADASMGIKLGDFGSAIRLQEDQLLKDKVGTPAFMAPEIHLLPNGSGYDRKVDVWAVGVSMVFLLANEYPFIDEQGKLLRDKLIQGDSPLWEASASQTSFEGFQEALGVQQQSQKNRFSPRAWDLTRHLLTLRWQNRLTALAALEHDWLSSPAHKNCNSDRSEKRPLLDIGDFEDALVRLGRDVNWVMNNLGCAPVGSFGKSLRSGMVFDDRFQNCVVCFSMAEELAHTCAQCHHAVCCQCLQQLPKATCPHCRHSLADDVAVRDSVCSPKCLARTDDGDKLRTRCNLDSTTDETGEACSMLSVNFQYSSSCEDDVDERDSTMADSQGLPLRRLRAQSLVSL